jgi:hypothetical protein
MTIEIHDLVSPVQQVADDESSHPAAPAGHRNAKRFSHGRQINSNRRKMLQANDSAFAKPAATIVRRESITCNG